MEIVKPGKYVEFTYEVYELDGGNEELMFSATAEHPDKTIFGADETIIPALRNALEGKAAKDRFDVVLEPKDAFGEASDENILDLERELFQNEEGVFDTEHIRVGEVVTMLTNTGQPVQGLILNVGNEKVKVDFNHPLAGKTVRFKGEVLVVRDATEEELHPSCGGCSCGCDHDSCGDGCGSCCH